MRKWPLLFAFLSVVVIGCAGNGVSLGGSSGGSGGGAGGGNGGGGGTGGRAVSPVNIPNAHPGASLIDVELLPGQSRQVGATETAFIGHVDFTDTAGFSTFLENPLPPLISLGLDAYNAQNQSVNAMVPAPTGSGSTNSRSFTSMDIFYQGFQQTTSAGTTPFTPDTTLAAGQNEQGDVAGSTFPGRITAFQIFLNDGMFLFDTNTGSVTLDETQFLAQNLSPVNNKISGFLSDYLEFDISRVPSKPQLVNTPGPAQKVFISGDNYALSQGGTQGAFEVLTPFGTFPGKFYPPTAPVNLKSYRLLQPNPTSITVPASLITALEGVFFDHTERINSSDTTLFISFPKQGDGARQDFVIVTRSGNSVTNMWFGAISFTAAGGPSFTAYPIVDLQPASVTNQSKGVVGGFLDKNGASVNTKAANWWQNVRAGTFSVTSAAAGIPLSGPFYVYRI